MEHIEKSTRNANQNELTSHKTFTIDASNKKIGIDKTQEDMRRKLICTVADPMITFEEKPEEMLRAISLASELGFDLHKSVYEGILAKSHNMDKVDITRIKEEFEKIISSDNAGKGVKMLFGTGLVRYILGDGLVDKLSKSEALDLDMYVANIDKTMKVFERRVALFFRCFEKNKALEAVKNLNFGEEIYNCISDGIHLLDKIYFIPNKFEMKKFLIQYGMGRYEFLQGLSKAQRIIVDGSALRIEARDYILKDIERNSEPIFVEDLAINVNDLVEGGIAEGNQATKILEMLLDVVHMKPQLNTRKDMLEYADKFSKSKMSAMFRKIKWIR